MHHRIDSLTSIVALTAILGSNVLNNVSWLDPVGGLLVSIMVIRAGWGNTGRALLELADVGIDHEIKDSVAKAVDTALDQQNFANGRVHGHDIRVREVQGIKAGQSYLVDVELAVPQDLTVSDCRPIEDFVRLQVGQKVRGMRRVKIKFVATNTDAPELADEFVSPDASSKVALEPEDESLHHDHEHHGHTHENHNHGNGHVDGDGARKRR